ncbi:hypothetical protein Trydic_g15546 [Trypoxylus dichotomus]
MVVPHCDKASIALLEMTNEDNVKNGHQQDRKASIPTETGTQKSHSQCNSASKRIAGDTGVLCIALAYLPENC